MGHPAINNISFNNDRTIIILTSLSFIRQGLSDGTIIRPKFVVLQKHKNNLWLPSTRRSLAPLASNERVSQQASGHEASVAVRIDLHPDQKNGTFSTKLTYLNRI